MKCNTKLQSFTGGTMFLIVKKMAIAVTVFAGCIIAGGCASSSVAIHSVETDKNHYVIIQHQMFHDDKVLDCYSIINGKWQPMCKEVTNADTK